MFQAADGEDVSMKQTKLFEQKKKYKNLESDKKTYIDESVKVIKKQKGMIEKIKKENEALKDLISKMNKDKSENVKTALDKEMLQEKLAQINSEIEQEKQSQKNIETHISNFQKKITEKRKNCLGMNSGAENQNNLHKQIKILQNRLDKANQKFNETTAHNKDLKGVIESLRRQRVIFDNLYKKLEKQLHEKRKKMADIIQKANTAYEERDKAHNQIQTLKTQAKKEASEFERQIKEMSYLLQKIKLSSYSKKVGSKGESQTGTNFFETDPVISHQRKNTKQIKKNADQVDKIQKFREDFAKIEAATQIQNFEELLRIFTENEQKNFQMFKFVNLQSNQIEELENEVFELKKELENSKEGEQMNTTKDQFITELESSLEILKYNYEETKKVYTRNQSQIRPLSVNIERIFETIECDRELAKELGGNKTITQNNLLIFLAIIQHKASKIVESFKKYSKPNLLSNQHKTQQMPMGMLTFDDFEDNEEYNKILSANQLRQKARDFIEKEQNQKQKKKEVRSKKK